MYRLIARAPVIVIVGAAVFATGACAGNADGGRTWTAITVNRD
jgi:hypothetical protein